MSWSPRRPHLHQALCVLAAAACYTICAHAAAFSATFSGEMLSAPIPESFLGLSIEPITQAKYYVTNPVFVQLISNLANISHGPLVIRWGGDSQDTHTTAYDEDTWKGLAKLHAATGVSYQLGLNLFSKDRNLAYVQVRNALKHLPPKSIFAIGIGNNPDYYHAIDEERFPLNYLDKTWQKQQAKFMKKLAPLLKEKLGNVKLFSGPDVTKPEVWRASQMYSWVNDSSTAKYVKQVTTNFFLGKIEDPRHNMDTILDPGLLWKIGNILSTWIRISHQNGAAFRLDQTNSYDKGGKAGVSDTLGGAMFTIDHALNMAKWGADGINFHMTSSSCSPYSAILLPTGCDGEACCSECDGCDTGSDPEARAPYYGLWMLSRILEGGATLFDDPHMSGELHARTYPYDRLPDIRVYALRSGERANGELRVVILRKDADPYSTDVEVSVYGKFTDAKLYHLNSPRNRTVYGKYPDMEVSGSQIAPNGDIIGGAQPRDVRVTLDGGTRSSLYKVDLPYAGVFLLVANSGF